MLFGGILLVLLGTVHVCIGFIALVRPELVAGDRADLLLPVSLTAIAWVHLVLGLIALVTGVGLIRGLTWARAVAVQFAVVAALVNFAFIQVYPVWSVIAVGLAVLIAWAAAAHGREVADAYGP